jgi:hypothetical protein
MNSLNPFKLTNSIPNNIFMSLSLVTCFHKPKDSTIIFISVAKFLICSFDRGFVPPSDNKPNSFPVFLESFSNENIKIPLNCASIHNPGHCLPVLGGINSTILAISLRVH